uniref:Palmitoyltransferase pfa3 n=1 Tax=Talaromyces marneffei PM1 TaxID=1077442 RepID=A0A093XK42_TALMA
MATSGSPMLSPKRRTRSLARAVERTCVIIASYFPLAFVYGLTTWAVWVDAGIGLLPTNSRWLGLPSSAVGVILYIMLNLSYTVAVFTDPGSPLGSSDKRGNGRGQYSHLPTTEIPEYQSYTVNRHGGARFSSLWVWDEVLSDVVYANTLMPVNVILLAVISGIIGLVLTGFTAWHISLAVRNLTTIESLEKTRYLSPLRKALDRRRDDYQAAHGQNGSHPTRNGNFTQRLQGYGQQILEAHANAIPGVTRAEEGEERPSPIAEAQTSHHEDYMSFLRESNADGTPAQKALHRSYEDLERQRERERYEDYLDSRDSENIPSPFNHGWKQNLRHLFGDNPLLWALPICNTSGDGWYWEPSPAFLEARDRIREDREREMSQWLERQRQQSYDHWMNPNNTTPTSTRPVPMQRFSKSGPNDSQPNSGVSMTTLRPKSPRLHHEDSDDDENDLSSEDEEPRKPKRGRVGHSPGSKADRVLGITRDQFGSPRDDWRDWD